jgi:hypothetical protein
MEQRSAANLERGVPAAVDGLESGFRVFESSTWRPTGSTSSPWADKKSKPRMGLYTAASKKVTKKVRSPNDRRRRMVPHVGVDLPSAPDSCGPAGCAFERCGRRSRKAAMKYVPGVESGGSKAFICRLISDGFMSPISGNLCSSNARRRRVVGPEVGDSECYVAHVLVLVVCFFLRRHLGC